LEVLIPNTFAPQVGSHGPKEMPDTLVQVIAQHRGLLVCERDTIYLFLCQSIYSRSGGFEAYKEKGYPMWLPLHAII
jgi:hypothetical protein